MSQINEVIDQPMSTTEIAITMKFQDVVSSYGSLVCGTFVRPDCTRRMISAASGSAGRRDVSGPSYSRPLRQERARATNSARRSPSRVFGGAAHADTGPADVVMTSEPRESTSRTSSHGTRVVRSGLRTSIPSPAMRTLGHQKAAQTSHPAVPTAGAMNQSSEPGPSPTNSRLMRMIAAMTQITTVTVMPDEGLRMMGRMASSSHAAGADR